MPISSVAQVLMRLFAVGWMITGGQLVTTAVFSGMAGGNWSLMSGLLYILFGLVFWFFAPALGRLAAKGSWEELTLEGVTEEQLLAAVLLGLGVYFTLDSFAGLINWGHFFAIRRSLDYGFHQESEPSYYEFSEAALTFAAGVALVLGARRLAVKLCRDRDAELQDDPNRPPVPPEEFQG